MTLAPTTPSDITPPPTDGDAALIRLWIDSKRKSAHTRATYDRAARRLLALGVPLRELTLRDLLTIADGLEGLSPASRKTYLSAIKSLLTFGQRSGYLPYNVGAALELESPKDTLAERILTEEQVQRMLAMEPDEEKRLLIRILYASGGRVSEVCNLRWRDAVAQRDTGQLTLLGKGSKTRAVVLSKATWKELERYRPEGAKVGDPIFRTRTGKPLHRSWVLKVVKDAAARAGLPKGVSPHWMRHAHASHALDRGAPAHLVQQTLGHASLTTTTRYVHARPEDSSARYLPV